MSKFFRGGSPPVRASVPPPVSFARAPEQFDPGAPYPHPRSRAEWEFQQSRGTAARTQEEWTQIQHSVGPDSGRIETPPKRPTPKAAVPTILTPPPIPAPPQVPVAPPPPAPTPAAAPLKQSVADAVPAAATAKREDEERRKRRVSRAATILTSPRGLLEAAPVAKKTLLGA